MIINILEHSDFSIHNIPFGIFSTKGTAPRAGVAIGEYILDLVAVAELGVFDFDTSVLRQPVLNDFIALGKSVTSKVRTDIQSWLQDDSSPLAGKDGLFVLQSAAQMHMPVRIGDYTDFYSSIEHATNVGTMFRGKENALMPNWKHLPVGYHGRASSIVVSGTPLHRPKGQILPKGETVPIYAPCRLCDFELEMGFIIGKKSELGNPVAANDAEEYIFGKVLFNDWSARDIQKWEYVPLGPFLGKNWGSSISPWIVTLDALAPFRVEGPEQDPKVLPYLAYEGDRNFDIKLEVSIQPEGDEETVICHSNFKYMYWNMSQQVAHHTVNGCDLNVGDTMASGTISGKDESSYGSLLEMTWAGAKTLQLKNGVERKFIQDNDTIIMRGYCEKDGIRVGFGEVSGKILPAK